MPRRNEPRHHAATALALGSRDHQEDAVITDFPVGAPGGVVVLADGMGGHAAGDVASMIVMTEVFSELKFQSANPKAFLDDAQGILTRAAHAANQCIEAHVAENPQSSGMGATLVSAMIHEDRMHWISIGDSPLYLYRDGVLAQLNEDHSMAPQIDLMVTSGLIDDDLAHNHPDRNCLTSVLSGKEIAKIDCPEDPFKLRDGDLVIVASDGLQFLEQWELATILSDTIDKPSAAIAEALLEGLGDLDHPDQDNVSIAVVKIDLGQSKPQHDTSELDATDAISEPAPKRKKDMAPSAPSRPKEYALVQPRRLSVASLSASGGRR